MKFFLVMTAYANQTQQKCYQFYSTLVSAPWPNMWIIRELLRRISHEHEPKKKKL